MVGYTQAVQLSWIYLVSIHSAAEGILFNILPVDYKNQLNAAIKTVGATPLFEFKKNLVFP